MYFYVILFYYGEIIDNEEIRNQIEILRKELRALGNSFADLKQDDARNVLAMQARSVLLERSERFFSEQKKNGKRDATALRCKEDLDGILEESIASFKQGGRDMALKSLLSYELGDHAVRSKEYSLACKRYAKEMLAQLRSYFESSDKILSPIGQDTDRISSVISTKERPMISPQSVRTRCRPSPARGGSTY
jgi:hypothetical protein